MRILETLLPGFLLVISFLLVSCCADPSRICYGSTPPTNFTSQFTMVQHQLRGVFTILDNCSFHVSFFDMLKGSDSVVWWGALATDLANFTNGFAISDQILNQTYSNDSFTVRLKDNVTWDEFNVVSVWDDLTASDYGHVVVESYGNLSNSFAPAPNVAEAGFVSYQTKPTMFENCKVLSSNFRIRWTLREDEDLIEIGLEAAVGIQSYMAFGWANPEAKSELMLGADITVTGFTEDGMPFADDYYITKYSECMTNKDGSVQGVCPDTIYNNSDPVGLVNNTMLVYGHRKDGVSFIRYSRLLESVDMKYDIPVNYTANMTVIWALGLIRPPDILRPYYLPQNHGGPRLVTFGHTVLNVSDSVNDCLGPLDAEDKEDQDLIVADGSAPVVVVSGPALHYPNPPNPSKVFYINKKEAPVLRVERGVSVKFSVQAGHNVALYITSDFVGGNATLRNATETIYAGGPEAEGVPASPYELVWVPDRNTPDQVYYQSVYELKMGWRIQVVDGGLPDMYNNSVVLDDQQVTLFWTLSEDSISFAARSEKKSGYLAIGFGRGMVNSFAYVGWVDNNGKGHVNTYWIDGRGSSNVHPTNENLTYVRCKSENGIITFEFTRPLKPSCRPEERPECANILDPTTPVRVIWAMGARWSENHLTERNMHSSTSGRPVRVLLMRGSAEAEQDLRPVLAVHGFMMFLAWGILLPGGVLAARYLKHVKGDGWYQIHVYLQYSGLSIVLLGALFAVAELRGLHFGSLHVKFGIFAIFLACVQPLNASVRPKKPASGEGASSKRLLWEYLHVIVGRSAILVGIAALISGMKHLEERYGGENTHGLDWALIIWFLVLAVLVIYLECREKFRRRDKNIGRSSWVLDNAEEDDSVDLLSPVRKFAGKEAYSSERMEVQLEPLSR